MNKTIFKPAILLTGLLATLLLGAASCSKEDDLMLDKKITLILLDDHYGWGSGTEITDYSSGIISFNVRDYSAIESVFFVISDLKTTSIINGNDINATVSIELFDLTNNTSILNSMITTDDVKASAIKKSINLKNSFPDQDINLGIRVTNTNSTTCSWELHAASLLLVRK